MSKKKKRRDSPISPAQEWAQGRNRAKGQVSYMLGTIDSMASIWNTLVPAEQNVLNLLQGSLKEVLKNWDRNSDKSKTTFIERETT